MLHSPEEKCARENQKVQVVAVLQGPGNGYQMVSDQCTYRVSRDQRFDSQGGSKSCTTMST